MARSDKPFEGIGGGGRMAGGITGSGGKNVNPVYKAVPEKTITLNQSKTKVVTIDKNGNITSRPFNRKNIK